MYIHRDNLTNTNSFVYINVLCMMLKIYVTRYDRCNRSLCRFCLFFFIFIIHIVFAFFLSYFILYINYTHSSLYQIPILNGIQSNKLKKKKKKNKNILLPSIVIKRIFYETLVNNKTVTVPVVKQIQRKFETWLLFCNICMYNKFLSDSHLIICILFL